MNSLQELHLLKAFYCLGVSVGWRGFYCTLSPFQQVLSWLSPRVASGVLCKLQSPGILGEEEGVSTQNHPGLFLFEH